MFADWVFVLFTKLRVHALRHLNLYPIIFNNDRNIPLLKSLGLYSSLRARCSHAFFKVA